MPLTGSVERVLPLCVMAAALAACSGIPGRTGVPPGPQISQRLGDEIALRALAQIGTAYRYGGADLNGFDCSGLVHYIHQQLGLETPRTAADQHAAASAVRREALQPGDLVFFRISSRRISHVGIYAGEGRFIHAPQTGRAIELRRLDEPYFARHYVGGGRLY